MVLEDGLSSRVKDSLVRNVGVREADLYGVLLVLDRIDRHGDLVVTKHYVPVLVQCRAEGEAPLLGQVVQLDVLP